MGDMAEAKVLVVDDEEYIRDLVSSALRIAGFETMTATDVAFSDYGVNVPSAPIVAIVDDHAVVEVQLYFTRS